MTWARDEYGRSVRAWCESLIACAAGDAKRRNARFASVRTPVNGLHLRVVNTRSCDIDAALMRRWTIQRYNDPGVTQSVLVESTKMDLMFLALTAVLFALTWGLVVLCDKVRS